MKLVQEKLNSNIAEYILFMYQMEDLLRACNLAIDKVSETLINDENLTDTEKNQQIEWYKGLINKLKIQKLESSGHLREVTEKTDELVQLHQSLLEYYKDEKYAEYYSKATPFIEEFRNKTDRKNDSNVSIMLHAMYGKLILKLKGKEISPLSEEAFDTFRIVLAYLSAKYKAL